jgi:hypothetical protein
MRGFAHCLGVMGGEPTLHPRFPDLCDYIRDNFPQSKPTHVFTGPSRHFVQDIEDHNLRLKRDTIRGLFSSLGPSYYRHFEKIQDTFGFQCLNDHLNPSSHGGLMITRRELGIPDDEWTKLRDNCWVQNLWSASITPKGAFFCEIAASLDMLLDGPGGWPVEKGWWEREPKDFGDQLQWCEYCSAALAVPKTDAREEKDDASPWWRDRLAALGSPKAGRGGVKLFSLDGYNPKDYAVTNHHRPYLADGSLRMSEANRAVFPDAIAVMTGVPPGEEVVLDGAGKGGWLLLTEGASVPEGIVAKLREWVFNPGCLYVDAEAGLRLFNAGASSLCAVTGRVVPERHYPAAKTVAAPLSEL